MKVVCIDNEYWEKWITIGKTYEVIEINVDGDYKIISDNDHIFWYPKDWFKSLAKIRNKKIDKLLKDDNTNT